MSKYDISMTTKIRNHTHATAKLDGIFVKGSPVCRICSIQCIIGYNYHVTTLKIQRNVSRCILLFRS